MAIDTTGTKLPLTFTFSATPSNAVASTTGVTVLVDSGGDNERTLTARAVTVGAPSGNDVTATFELDGWIRAGETAAVTAPLAYISDDNENAPALSGVSQTNNSTTAKPKPIVRWLPVELSTGERIVATPQGGPIIDRQTFKLRVIAEHMDALANDAGDDMTVEFKVLCGGDDTPTDPTDATGWVSAARVNIAPEAPSGDRHSEAGVVPSDKTYADVVWEAEFDATDIDGEGTAASNGWFEAYVRATAPDGTELDTTPTAVGTNNGDDPGVIRGYIAGTADSYTDVYYSYVDEDSGNNGTGVASTTAATAAASPFATIEAAWGAIQTARGGNIDGSRTRMVARASGGMTWATGLRRTNHGWAYVEPAPGDEDAITMVFDTKPGSSPRTPLVCIRGIDIDASSANQVIDNNSSNNRGYNYNTNAEANVSDASYLWLDDFVGYATGKVNTNKFFAGDYSGRVFATRYHLRDYNDNAATHQWAALIDGYMQNVAIDGTKAACLVLNRRTDNHGDTLAADLVGDWTESSSEFTASGLSAVVFGPASDPTAQLLPTAGTGIEQFTKANAPEVTARSGTTLTLDASIAASAGDLTDITAELYLLAHGDAWQIGSAATNVVRVHDDWQATAGQRGKLWQCRDDSGGAISGLLCVNVRGGRDQYVSWSQDTDHALLINTTHDPVSFSGSSNEIWGFGDDPSDGARDYTNIKFIGCALRKVGYSATGNTPSLHAFYADCNFRTGDTYGVNASQLDTDIWLSESEGNESFSPSSALDILTGTPRLNRDILGETIEGTYAFGAAQPPPPEVARAPMRMSDLLTPTVSLEADPATVLATATATFYVDFEAGSDGSGTSGSPWNTLAGKEATIDAVVGSVAVVMAGIADGQQIAGLAFSNGSGTTLSFISWHLLDGAKTRAHWTPAIKMDRIDTPSMSGSVIDYDLTDIETALAARGWSGTFDVQAVLSGYTPFTGQTSIPASGLRTLAQDLVTDGAYYESFRRVTGSAKVVWEEVGSAAAVSVADTWHFDGTTDVVRARQATVPDDGYIVYLDDAGNQVVTISGWEEPRFLGVRFFLLGDRGDRRFVQATTKRMLLQDIECEGTGADDTFALLNSAGDANSGLTMRRCQFSGMGKDGNPIVVSTNTTPDYKSWHSIDTISHAGWRYEYTDSVPTGGLQGTDAGILNDQATYFGAPHAGDLEEIRIERGFGFAYNSKTARLIQSQPNDSPTDYTDISDYKAVLIGLRAEGLSGIDQANVYRRTLVVACNLEGAGNAANSHLFGRNGNLGEAVGFVACILRGSVSMRSAIALWGTTNAFISRCLFHCDQNGISAKQGANAWTGEVTLDNNLYLFINDNKSWWGVAQGGGEVTASVADSIKDIDGGLEIAEAFENCDFYENTLDHTDQTSADVDATFPDNSNVYDTSMTVPANGAATSANLSTRGIPEIDGVLTVIEGDDVSINGQLHSGTFGPFQYGGFGVSAGGILSRSRLWRSRLQRI